MDERLGHVIHHYGAWSYAILFVVLFAETGFVVTPFLPGDTLLFAAGIFADPSKHAFNIWLLLALLTAAPLAGDSVNFAIGRWLGPRLFQNERSRIFNRKALDRTHGFFERYGQRTIVLARWVPVVRTFAPFVAGMSGMRYRLFIFYSAVGAALWVWTCTLAGFFLGGLPAVRENFGLAMLVMIGLTVIPLALEVVHQRDLLRAEARAAEEARWAEDGGAERIRTAE